MFCQECGAKNDDDAKHCKECGAKLSNVSAPKQEKSSFIKEHKKMVLCIVGILVIFVIIALISIGSNQTDVNPTVSSGIEKVLEDNGYSVSRSVKDGSVRLSGTKINLTDNATDEGIVDVHLYSFNMLKEISSKFNLSPREINGIDGYGGYSEKMYTYAFVDNENTIVIIAPSKDSPILDALVKKY